MGGSTPLIVAVSTPAYGRVVIDTSDGHRYHADLAPVFSAVYCFPKTPESWASVSPDASGLSLVWSTRFEVHVDQVLALADQVERPLRTG